MMRRSFTLIEIMVVMGLIVVALGALSFPIAQAVKTERFERGVDDLITKITLAQEIMLDFRTDITLHLEQKENAIQCQIIPAIAMPQNIQKALNHHEVIKGISQIAFNHHIETQIEICFDASIGAISQGLLSFSNGKREATLFLPGYPKHLKRGDDESFQRSSVSYPKEIFSSS